jgi:DNA-directed RNA polymerase specialized sigma24 family protein
MTNAMHDAFMKSQKVIYKAVYDYMRPLYRRVGPSRARRLVPWEDLLSVSYEAFVERFADYDPQRSAITTWAYQTAQMAMNNFFRRRLNAERLGQLTEEITAPHRDSWHDRLTGDALFIADKIVNPPERLLLEFGTQQTPSQVLRVIRDFLWELGWSNKRILESFREITEAL